MNNLILGRYFPGNSWIHHLDPRSKLIACIYFIIVLFLANNWETYALLWLFTLLVMYLSGVSFRTYGEFADDYKPNIPVLKGHYCTFYTGWDLATRDTTRFYQWKKDFDSLLANNALPQLNTLRFGNDHTEGLSKGRPTPFAHVADNDLAIGKFIDYLSKSSVWKESAVFILEDDAQNGVDHVDGHRTVALAISPYTRRGGEVDSTNYNQTSIVRTMEIILGTR
jgi:hypothetical protein